MDEFSRLLDARGVAPGRIEEVGTFGDLLWPPAGDVEELMRRHHEDPAFTVTSEARLVALARIANEIRFYAGALEHDTDESEREIAIFANVADAVTFTIEYLSGGSLERIGVVRRKPSW